MIITFKRDEDEVKNMFRLTHYDINDVHQSARNGQREREEKQESFFLFEN